MHLVVTFSNAACDTHVTVQRFFRGTGRTGRCPSLGTRKTQGYGMNGHSTWSTGMLETRQQQQDEQQYGKPYPLETEDVPLDDLNAPLFEENDSLLNGHGRPNENATTDPTSEHSETDSGYRSTRHIEISGLEDASAIKTTSSERRVMRAALCFLLSNVLHELVVYKLTYATTWANVMLFIPFEFLGLIFSAALATLYMRKTSSQRMQEFLGITSISLLPSMSWLQPLSMAFLTVSVATLRIFKDSWTEVSQGTSLCVS